MGCMSSKLISRSISFKDELSLKRQGTAKSKAKAMPLLEEMLGSNKGSDHFLALVCTANTVSHNLNSTNIVSLETKAAASDEDRIDVPKRSKSWHQFPQEEEESAWRSNGVARSRSFHTVEEYDALLEKLRVTGFLQNEIVDDYTVLGIEEEMDSVFKATEHPLEDDNEPLEREVTVIEAISEEEKELLVVEEKDAVENGNKRHEVSKRLESLKIPTTVEFTAIGSLREWLQGGGKVYSPGAYVTPKFGSYSSSDSKTKNKSSEGYVFNPELVTAIEEHMQQLEVEEETILKQISGNWEAKVEEIVREAEKPSTKKEDKV